MILSYALANLYRLPFVRVGSVKTRNRLKHKLKSESFE